MCNRQHPVHRWIAPQSALLSLALLFALESFQLNLAAIAAEPPAADQGAVPADVEQAFGTALSAGRFDEALAAAKRAAEPAERDRLFARLAELQFQEQRRGDAVRTAAEIVDDRIRGQVLAPYASAERRLSPSPRGGQSFADFDSLMDLIRSTVAPEDWDEVGGKGTISPLKTGGVFVDPQGVFRTVAASSVGAAELRKLRRKGAEAADQHDARRTSAMRMVSLPRLERQVQLRLAAGELLDEEMMVFAGLRRIDYVLVYPETNDLVVAGPAGDWAIDGHARVVATDTRRPVLRLDDLVVVWRKVLNDDRGTFGCSITPRTEGLAKAQQFLDASTAKPLKPGRREAWLEQVRSLVGLQDIEVFGIAPSTRAARILVEADYHMKLIGIGIVPGTIDVPSYLDLVAESHPADGKYPPLDVLRWWFTFNNDAVLASEERDAFQIPAKVMRVQSENELLSALGKRIHTGASNPLNQQFADQFTNHLAALAEKYPIYAELENLFDLTVVAALIESERLADRANWHLTCFNDPRQFTIAEVATPRTVETVMNHRIVTRRHFIAAVSGGVQVDAATFLKSTPLEVDHDRRLDSPRGQCDPRRHEIDTWWWDS